LCQEQFDRLLVWLDADRERAGEKYEAIRGRLIQLFRYKGAVDCQELADKTIDRVARKLHEIDPLYCGDPAHYFCGVAGKIFWEHRRNQTPEIVPLRNLDAAAPTGDRIEVEHASLEACIAKLRPKDRELVLNYYQLRKMAKIEHRKGIADRMGCSAVALRVRATRLRSGLMKCVLLRLGNWIGQR
jgi:DNA-directed RNA polymerase specialized sigma24 family protein